MRIFGLAFFFLGFLLNAANADDCFLAVDHYLQMCPHGRIENGLEYLRPCDFEKAKTNFLWASKKDPGAVKTFRNAFDHCSTNVGALSTPIVVLKNYYSAILAQTHNMDALCSIRACWETGELTGYLEYENSVGHLYAGNSPPPKQQRTPQDPGLTDGCNCPTCAFTCSWQ